MNSVTAAVTVNHALAKAERASNGSGIRPQVQYGDQLSTVAVGVGGAAGTAGRGSLCYKLVVLFVPDAIRNAWTANFVVVPFPKTSPFTGRRQRSTGRGVPE